VDAELLLALAAEVADKRNTRDVLDTIVGGLADLPGVVLAGIWLLRPGDLCEKCSLQADCRDPAQWLHLVASAGNSQISLAWQYSRIAEYRRALRDSMRYGDLLRR
jgi:hypothetical protein